LTRRKALEGWETKIANTEVTPQAIWPIAKSPVKRNGSKAPTAIRGPLGFIFHLLEKAKAIADCLERQLTSHDVCDEKHKWGVESRVQALLETVNNPPKRIRSCDLQKLVNSLKIRKACGIDGIPNECLRQLPKRHLVHLTRLFNHCLSGALEGCKNYNLTETG
jgi:hypothetical protein